MDMGFPQGDKGAEIEDACNGGWKMFAEESFGDFPLGEGKPEESVVLHRRGIEIGFGCVRSAEVVGHEVSIP
jgi:hypothetical protein